MENERQELREMAFMMRAAYHADKRTFERVMRQLEQGSNGHAKTEPRKLDREGIKMLSLLLSGKADQALGGR